MDWGLLVGQASLVPRPSSPNICRLQYVLTCGKTESRAMTYLDMRRSGTFLESPQVSECTTDCKHEPKNVDTRQSWRCFMGPESRFTAVQKESATPPHIQVRHCTWLRFTSRLEEIISKISPIIPFFYSQRILLEVCIA